MIGQRDPETCSRVIELLEEGLRVMEICEILRVNRRYVYRVQASFSPVYVPRETPQEIREAKRALDIAYATFERQSNPRTYSELCDARRRYEAAIA